jgi:putative tryptophan/tyrosine transport system substrate-binding protein
MRRRDFVASLLSVATLGHARAQQNIPAKTYHLAIVDAGTPVADMTEKNQDRRAIRSFFEEIRLLGYVEGQNLLIDRFSGEGTADIYPELAREIVRGKPDVIFAVGNQTVLAVKAATTTIPIVGIADPVALGIVPNLARPGGNITGISANLDVSIWAKRVELLRELTPGRSKAGFLDSRYGWEASYGAIVRDAARRVGISLIGPPLEAPFFEAEYRRVLSSMTQQGVETLIVGDLQDNLSSRRLLVKLAEERRLPTIYPYREYVKVGGLMSYSVDLADIARHAVHQIDSILKVPRQAKSPSTGRRRSH